MENELKRLEWIDMCKGIGIITMVGGHIGLPYIIDKYIHAWHMPIFFILSGYLFKEYTVKNLILKKSKTLFIPYFVFGALLYLFSIIRNLFFNDTNLIKQFYDLLTFNTIGNLPFGNSLWFLTCIFCVEVIFNLLKTYSKNELILFINILIICILGYLFSFIGVRMIWGLDTALTSVVFYYFGYLLKKNKDSVFAKIIYNSKLWIILVCLIASIILEFTNGYVNLRLIQYSNIVLFYINGIFISLTIIMISIYSVNKFKKLLRPIIFIGQNSLVYLALNQFIIYLITLYPFNLRWIIKFSFILIVTLAILGILSIIINRYFPYMLGKFKKKEKLQLKVNYK